MMQENTKPFSGEHPKLYVLRREAADYLTKQGYPIRASYLQKLATIGGGPVYRKFGNRALYTPSDLLAWAESRLTTPIQNTSEIGG